MGTCPPFQAIPHAAHLRRGGDSNPRYPLEVQRLSRAPDSATLAPLPIHHPSRSKAPIQARYPRVGRQPLSGNHSPCLPPAVWGSQRARPDFCPATTTVGRGKSDRRGRDSNPRNRDAAQLFSRPPPSTTRTPLPSMSARAAWGKTPETARQSRSSGRFDYTDRPRLCQRTTPRRVAGW